jgi:hypothetical protein
MGSFMLISVCVGLTGCGLECTTVLKFGIVVTVVDSVTNLAPDTEVTAIARDGPFTDTSNVPPGVGTLALAQERAGTYMVEIRVSGYLPWVGSAVRVTEDRCHVQPVLITARLQGNPG